MRRFIALMLVLVIVFSCVGCGSFPTERCFVEIGEYRCNCGHHINLVFDPVTKVEYFEFGGALCPRYDKNGNVVVYGGK